MKKTYKQALFEGERACFATRNAIFEDCIFQNGESPLKESADIKISGGYFRWKYPLWYCKNVVVRSCSWTEGARAGVWYTEKADIADCVIQSPKNFRRCKGLTLTNVFLSNAQETLWTCLDVTLKNVQAKGDYLAMNCENVQVDGLMLDGNYSFDGAKNVTIRNSRLLTKDAFWNSENITVYDSYIAGEYLGWNSRNLTLVNCTIESLQGLCYCENVVLRDCKFVNTTLAFEYSVVDAVITNEVDSVFNPRHGYIKAPLIKEFILEEGVVKASDCFIDCSRILEKKDKPEWK